MRWCMYLVVCIANPLGSQANVSVNLPNNSVSASTPPTGSTTSSTTTTVVPFSLLEDADITPVLLGTESAGAEEEVPNEEDLLLMQSSRTRGGPSSGIGESLSLASSYAAPGKTANGTTDASKKKTGDASKNQAKKKTDDAKKKKDYDKKKAKTDDYGKKKYGDATKKYDGKKKKKSAKKKKKKKKKKKVPPGVIIFEIILMIMWFFLLQFVIPWGAGVFASGHEHDHVSVEFWRLLVLHINLFATIHALYLVQHVWMSKSISGEVIVGR